jgi:uncharacterized damage-inducible protein DinB
MFTHISDFVRIWKYESESTLKYLQNLTNESLPPKPNEQIRSAGFLSWHMIRTVSEMINKTGLEVKGKEQENYNGETVEELINEWNISSASLIEQITTKWTDADLLKEDDMYDEKWKRGTTLHILITHMAHHRGQLSVVMRLRGLKVPGVYGPAQEEWAQWGMQPML